MRLPVKGRMRPFIGAAHVPPRRTVHARSGSYSCASSAVISLTADLASPNSIAVLGS
jgi:hypothetical protein